MSIGLPVISLEFKSLAASIIERSERGIVAVLLLDDTEGGEELNTYKSITDIDFEKWTEDNYNYLKMIFTGGASKVIALRQKTTAKNVSEALKKLKDLIWNYFVYPAIEEADKTTVVTWIKEQRDEKQKTFKAVIPKATGPDHEGVINFTTDNIKSVLTGKTHTAAQYSPFIAGVLAGMPLTRSATYYEMSDVVSADTYEDPDENIDGGELIIVYDGEKYVIGRGVNSLTTFTGGGKTEDMRKIKIVEGMDIVRDDIRNTFKNSYVGKYNNFYDNKQLFVAAVLAYFREIEGDVLDPSYDNTCSVDAEANKEYLEARGKDTSAMSETELAEANTDSNVFLTSDVKFVDAMEDLKMTVNM